MKCTYIHTVADTGFSSGGGTNRARSALKFFYLPDKDFMVPYFSANFIFHPYETKFCGIEKWYAGTEKWYAGTEKWSAGIEKWMSPGLKSGQPKK